MMKRIRKPAVAGSFYPSDPGVLRTTVDTLLAEAKGWHGAAPLALVAPHAGYVYSGPVAASAYACLKPFRERYRRVVLLGPAHRAAVRGIALPDVDAFASPLGDVALDRETMDALDGPDVMVDDAAHRLEHSLEVHLPFLQYVLDGFTLVPILVGDADPELVARALDALRVGLGEGAERFLEIHLSAPIETCRQRGHPPWVPIAATVCERRRGKPAPVVPFAVA